MNAVGIDVYKGKSMVAVMRPFGEVVASPFEVGHTTSELKKLADFLKNLNGEIRVTMENTSRYFNHRLFSPQGRSICFHNQRDPCA
jgi:hypothetical protein